MKNKEIYTNGWIDIPVKVLSARTYYKDFGDEQSIIDEPTIVFGIKQRDIFDCKEYLEKSGIPQAWIRESPLDITYSRVLGESKNRRWFFGGYEDEPKRARGVAEQLEKEGYTASVELSLVGCGQKVYNVYIIKQENDWRKKE